MPTSPRRQDVAHTLLAEVAGDCYCHFRLEVNRDLPCSIPHDKVSPFLLGH